MEPLDPKLARLVHEGMVQAVPGPEIEERVLQGLLARLPPAGPGRPDGGPGEGLAGGGPASSVATTASGAKAWLWAAALGATVIGGAWVAGRSPAPTPPERPVAEVEPATVASASDVARPGPPKAATTPEPAPVPAPESRASPSRARSPRASAASTAAASPLPDDPPQESADGLADEIQRIAAAEAALARGDADEALRLAHAHANAHPRGQLGVERVAIELAARCALGRPGVVEATAAFLRAHGRTPAAAKVRARCPGSSDRDEDVHTE